MFKRIGRTKYLALPTYEHHKRSKNWVAAIEGLDPKYKFNRRFIKIHTVDNIKASEIRRQLQLMKNQGLEKHKEIIRKFFEFYNDKLPYSVLKNISIDSFDYDPETNTLTLNISSDYAGHIIGKQGAKVKAFQEATGIKLRIVTPEAET